MRRKPGKQHINEKYSPSHLKRLGKMAQVSVGSCSGSAYASGLPSCQSPVP